MYNDLIPRMMSIVRSGGDPIALVRNMANQDPKIRQFLSMVQGKSTEQLRQLAENVAKERGISINDLARQLHQSFQYSR